MFTAGDALAKTLAKSQKVTFWSQNNSFGCFFFFANRWRCSYTWIEKMGGLASTRNEPKCQVQCKSVDLPPPRVYKLGTHSVLLRINLICKA